VLISLDFFSKMSSKNHCFFYQKLATSSLCCLTGCFVLHLSFIAIAELQTVDFALLVIAAVAAIIDDDEKDD